MASFLELCASVARESGAVSAAPSSVSNQTGRQLKCVEWTREAWTQIQNDNADWSFLRSEFTSQLLANVMTYAPASFSLPSGVTKWLMDLPERQSMTIYPVGAQDQEVPLRQISYDLWRERFNRGVHDPLQPVYWASAPDGSFLVGPKPDQAYVIRGEYVRQPQVLALDGDVPIMPAQYHNAIVWRACALLAEHDEAPMARQSAALKYDAIYRDMVRDLLPDIDLGGNALA